MERVWSKASRLCSFSAVELLWLKENRDSSSTRMGGRAVNHVCVYSVVEVVVNFVSRSRNLTTENQKSALKISLSFQKPQKYFDPEAKQRTKAFIIKNSGVGQE